MRRAEQETPGVGDRSRTGRGSWLGIDALLVLAVMVAFAPIVADNSAQPASRYSLTAAFAEERSVDLGPYAGALGVDHAVYRGELRSDKAPGQPLLGVPFYLAARALGSEPATHLRVRGNLGLWWQTLWLATVPFAALLVLMRRAAASFAGRDAVVATVSIGFATMLLPYAVNLYGQVLAALLGFGAWLLVERSPVTRERLLAGGAIAGVGATVEYHVILVVIVLAAYCLVGEGRRAGWFALGSAVPLTLLGWYQRAAFGAPWRLPYAYWAGTEPAELRVPGPSAWWHLLVDDRGLLLASPIVLLAVAGAATGAVSSGPLARHCRIGLLVAACYLVLSAGWTGTRYSEEPGPRYLIVSLPFLAAPLAAVWQRWKLAAWAATMVGGVAAILASVTFIITPSAVAPLRVGLERVAGGEFAPTLWSMALGRWGIAVHGLTVAAAGVPAWWAWQRTPSVARWYAATSSDEAGDATDH